jgi:hypothetical protein
MRKRDVITIAFALWLIIVPLLLSAAPSAAQPADNEMKNLVQDISAYFDRCKGVQASPPMPLSRSCANEKAQLPGRQPNLHLSDADVNAQLNAGLRTVSAISI